MDPLGPGFYNPYERTDVYQVVENTAEVLARMSQCPELRFREQGLIYCYIDEILRDRLEIKIKSSRFPRENSFVTDHPPDKAYMRSQANYFRQ